MNGRLLPALIAILALQITAPGDARAQLVIDHEGETSVRGFHGAGIVGGVQRSFQSDAEAKAEFDHILSAIGLNWIGDRISLRASADTSNAEAGISKKGERFIFYNATFMQKLKERTAEHWSLLSVLAHELGHHLAFHTELTGNDHKYELEADYFSGFVLRRMGATLDQSHAAMRAISPKEATKSHPGLEQRLQVITIGWTDGGRQGAPRGLQERASGDPAGPAAAAPASPYPTGQSAAAEAWPLVKDTTSIAALEAYIRRYGDTFHGDLARIRLDEVRKSQPEQQMRDETQRQRDTAAPALAAANNRAEALRLFNKGLVYAIEGDHTRAIADYDQAIRLDPNLADGFHGRGTSYAFKGDHTRAIADYDEAIRLDPKLAGAFHGRGTSYAFKGDHTRAIADYGEAIRLDPKLAGAFHGRGASYAWNSNHTRAIADYDEAIRLDSKLARAYYGRGVFYAWIGDDPRALADYRKAVELDPSNNSAKAEIDRLAIGK